MRAGALASRDLDEVSGLVASSREDGVFFVNNDSGDSARFFAIDRTGKLLATYTYSRNAVVDCEEIARGPCDAPRDVESCLFIGDVGDNAARRDHVVVYRVREPKVIEDATVEAQALRPEVLGRAARRGDAVGAPGHGGAHHRQCSSRERRA